MTGCREKVSATDIRRSKMNSSRIFRQNRALGYVSNQIPAVIRFYQRRKDNLITTCIGRSFQMYTASHFRLIHVSSVHPDEITALAIDRSHIYTASDKCIFAWRSGKHIRHIYSGHTRNVHILLPFGRKHIIAVDEDNLLKVWDINKEEIYLDIPFNVDEFLVSAVAHPPTYLNKIVLGSHQGKVKIWNLKENHLIYTFAKHKNRVTCIQPSPAIDVIGVGHQDGKIYLLNLKFDEILMDFQQDWGYVSCISFRTDGLPIMATSSSNGHIAFWNLEDKKIVNQVQAHEASVSTAIFLPNEPLLFTASPDNSMKLWIFDVPFDGARMLRIREGHTAPPLCIRYHGSNGYSILTSGEDSSMRVFSTISETLNKSMGKASYNRKASKKKNRFHEDSHRMPPVTEFTTETTREKEWDNIAAIHSGTIQTTTWSFQKNRMGEHRLVPEKFYNKNRSDYQTETTCLTLTQCGNFVIIGYSNGDVERFNIQSGLHRASYGRPAHCAAVRGVCSDNLNQFVVSGCGEGLLKFWPFTENGAQSTAILKFTDGITLMRYHRESAMIAAALVNFAVYIIDSDARTVIRKFEGHSAKINDATFSPNSRWLITAAMDSTIKIWDIPSSYMIDHFHVERPCISLSLSPTGDFLATAHVNFLGVYLWANKMLFSPISLSSVDPYSVAPYVGLPTSICLEHDAENWSNECNIEMPNDEHKEIDLKYRTPEQLSVNLISFSGVSNSSWQNLLDLELIKKHNKPIAPPKVPKQAPFFLPTFSGLEMKFNPNTSVEQSKVLKNKSPYNLTILGQMLEETLKSNNFENCIKFLKQLSPSMIDFEIKSLLPIEGGSHITLVQFLKTIEYMFTSNLNFELAQSYLSVFLRSHGATVQKSDEVTETIKRISKIQEKCWLKIESKLIYCMGVVTALRNFVH